MQPVIDIHVHIQPLRQFRAEAVAQARRGHPNWAQVEEFCERPGAFLDYLDSAGVERAGLINYVSPEVTGFTAEANDWVAKYASADPRRLIAFGSVHPRHTPQAAAETDRLAALGIRALKIHPSHQWFAPNAYRGELPALGAVYERAQAHGMPVMIHTGTSVFTGARNLFAQPMLADDIGVDYPGLVVILAHGGRPLWMNEAFFLVRRHPNFYMDISSIPARRLLEYFPRIEEIADKVLFGTDWPGFGMNDLRAGIEGFRALPVSAEAQRKILYDNAARLFAV
ncbi:MAG TPA: amidohydrolase family protein [Candidatus Acidoferrales bacterium]|nr:amidohydrolase family protein [Candidatus Acidoferrales bacterium]